MPEVALVIKPQPHFGILPAAGSKFFLIGVKCFLFSRFPFFAVVIGWASGGVCYNSQKQHSIAEELTT